MIDIYWLTFLVSNNFYTRKPNLIMDVNIRKAKTKDVDEISGLQDKLIEYHHKLRKGEIEPWEELVSSHKDLWKEFAKTAIRSYKKVIFVAVDNDNKIVGYTAGMIKKNIPIFKIKKLGYINDLFVIKKYRNKGIAEKLLKTIEKWFKSKNIKYVEVSADTKNKLGQKVWHKFGFEDCRLNMMKEI